MELTTQDLREELQRKRKEKDILLMQLGKVDGIMTLLEQQITYMESEPGPKQAGPDPAGAPSETENGSRAPGGEPEAEDHAG